LKVGFNKSNLQKLPTVDLSSGKSSVDRGHAQSRKNNGERDQMGGGRERQGPHAGTLQEPGRE
jgi:hypothetical protein